MTPVPDPFANALRNWQGFYQATGESAATLTGLMFVMANVGAKVFSSANLPLVRAFITPILSHFMTAFVISAFMCIPAQSDTNLVGGLGILGMAGLVALAALIRSMSRWNQRHPLGARHWAYHMVLPTLSYLSVLSAAGGLWFHKLWALNIVGYAVMAFIVIGVINAWEATLKATALSPEEIESINQEN